jgi:putative glutamine transport system permease protein
MTRVLGEFDLFVSGFLVTIQLALLAVGIALATGLVVALLRVNPLRPLRAVGTAYVEFARNVPLLTHMFLWVFGLPFIGIVLPEFTGAVLGLGFYTAAYVAEAIRAGILAVSRGQVEAARSLGLTYTQTMRYVVLPQAFATVVPPLGNLAIAATKNTAVAAAVTVPELLYQTQRVNARTFATYEVFFVSAAFYLALTLPLGALGSHVERQLTRFRATAS